MSSLLTRRTRGATTMTPPQTNLLQREMREKARKAGVLTPHILADGSHLSHARQRSYCRGRAFRRSALWRSILLRPMRAICICSASVGSPEIKKRFLEPLVEGRARSAFFMTEPAAEGGAGSDPLMMQTTAVLNGNHWVINGRKAFITGAQGAKVGIIMAKSEDGACMFLVDLPDPAIRVDRIPNTIKLDARRTCCCHYR